MIKKSLALAAIAAFSSATALMSCKKANEQSSDVTSDWIEKSIEAAAGQLKATAAAIDDPNKFPRSLNTDYSLELLTQQLQRPATEFKVGLTRHPSLEEFRQVHYCDYGDWTSGFFPGSLWLAYEMTGDEDLKEQAKRFTNTLLPVSYKTDTHDLGFMVNCSYGNAFRLAPNDSIKDVMVRTADNLIGRFNPQIGAIRSWDFGQWNYPVIIDNMMNLELLFNATKLTGDSTYYDVAVKHAETTLKNHFRDDFTTYHVVSYNDDGTVESKGTHQGKADDSSWARGQAWALYGFTEAYRETGDKQFLDQAVAIADMIIGKNATDDLIPYWDFDAPALPTTPRDASAAAIFASGMIDLSSLANDGQKYLDYAIRVLQNLSTDKYLAKPGENDGFILAHSTGSLPQGSEIDTPINYADYYYLEALNRLSRLTKNLPPAAPLQ